MDLDRKHAETMTTGASITSPSGVRTVVMTAVGADTYDFLSLITQDSFCMV